MSGLSLIGASRADRSGRTLVRDIDLSLGARGAPGEVVGLVGPNGAGKSTVLRLLAGVWRPTGGRVELDAVALERYSRRDLAKRVAYVPQSATPLFDFTVFDLITMGRYPHHGRLAPVGGSDVEVVAQAIERCDLVGFEERRVTALSGGELQRVLIARSLATGADVLLFDEPTANLDIAHSLSVMNLCRELAHAGKSIAIALHDLSLARRFADRLVLLSGGALIAGGAAREVLTAARIEQVFGVRVSGLGTDPGSPLRFDL